MSELGGKARPGKARSSGFTSPPHSAIPQDCGLVGARSLWMATAAQGVCYNFWSINNFTSQHMFADPGYGERIKRDKPFMKQVNCVRLLGGRHDGRNAWFKGVDENGKVDCDFSEMIQYLRGIQDAGFTPRIVLDNIPTAMSEPGELAKYGNTRPAKDLKIWHEYVRQAVQAMVDAFGIETVSNGDFASAPNPI